MFWSDMMIILLVRGWTAKIWAILLTDGELLVRNGRGKGLLARQLAIFGNIGIAVSLTNSPLAVPSKHHFGPIHQHVRPYYLHMPNLPTFLPRAAKPSSERGCAEILGDPYHKMVPLPRIPNYRDLGRRQNPLSVHDSNIAQRTRSVQRTNLARVTSLLNGHTKLMEKSQ